MEQTATVPLGTILGLHLHLPMLTDHPHAITHLVGWMAQGRLTPITFPLLLERCRADLQVQLPWLVGICYPSARLSDGLWAWAWRDTQEIRFGAQQTVRPLPDADLPPVSPPVMGYLDPDGQLHGVEFDELPEPLQHYLRHLGYQD